MTGFPGRNEQVVDPVSELGHEKNEMSVCFASEERRRSIDGRFAYLVETFLDEGDGEHAVLDADPHAERRGTKEGKRVSLRPKSRRDEVE